MPELSKKAIIVTGATGGIGRAIATVAGREGAIIGIQHRGDGAKAVALQRELRESFETESHLLCFDIRDPGETRAACDPFLAQCGLDGWVNAAAIQRPGLLVTQTASMIDEQVATNVSGTLLGCQLAVEAMFCRDGGSIVNIGSVTASRPNRGQAVYAATKGAVSALTRALAHEYGRKGVRVNCVVPGPVETDMSRDALALAGGEVERRVPLGRLAAPIEVAEVVVFLLSDRASYVTGVNLPVDGGFEVG